MRRVVVGLAAAVALGACAGTSSSSTRTTTAQDGSSQSSVASSSRSTALAVPATTSPTAAAATPAPTTRTTLPTLGVTGFGAATADWNAHHVADDDFQPGSVYDRDPALPTINGHEGARYVTVSSDAGHVTSYTLNFPPGTALAEAKAAALQELPADVIVRWYVVRDDCAQADVTSVTLGRALADQKIGDPGGEALITMTSPAPPDKVAAPLDQANVDGATFLLGEYPSAVAGPPC